MPPSQPETAGLLPHPPARAQQQLGKRSFSATEIESDDPSLKRQHTEPPPMEFDLDDLVFLYLLKNRPPARCSLNYLGDCTFPNKLRAHHYSYDRFRKWLSDEAGIDVLRPVVLGVRLASGDVIATRTASCYDFSAVLVYLKNKTYTPLHDKKLGYYLQVSCPQTPPAPTKPVASVEADKRQDRPSGAVKQAEVQGGERDGASDSVVAPDKPASPRSAAPDEPARPGPAASQNPASASPEAAAQTQPLTIDLCSDVSDDPDASAGNRARTLEPRLDGFSNETLRRALRFFNTEENNHRQCIVLGCQIRLHSYQLYRIYLMFMSAIIYGINGGMIGWDVGFGKTIMTWLFLRVRSRLANRWDRVQSEWAGPPPDSRKRSHLPKDGQKPGQKCPTQGICMVECPCVFDSDSRRICETYLTNTPALVIMPAGLGPSWLAEYVKLFGKDPEPSDEEDESSKRPLNIYTYMSDLKGRNNLGGGASPEHVERIIAKTSADFADDNGEMLYSLLTKGEGSAKDVFLASNGTVQQLQNRYPDLEGYQNAKCFTVGVIIMDEFQKYRGVSGKTDTIPFRVLYNISRLATHPVSLFTLGGTTVEEGPTSWRAPIRHFENQWDWHGKSMTDQKGLRPDELLSQLPEVRRKYYGLQRDIAAGKISSVDLKAEARVITTFLQPTLSTLRQNQIYRGERVNPLPPLEECTAKFSCRMSNRTKEAFNFLMTNVNTLMEKRLEEALSEWKDNKSAAEKSGTDFEDPEPTIQLLMADLASGEKSIKGNFFVHLQRSSMYPYLAVLLTDNDGIGRKGEEFDNATKSKPCQGPAIACQKALLNGGERAVALEHFQTWEFTSHQVELARDSAKYAKLRKYLAGMVVEKDPLTEPADKSGKRHAILFFTQSIAAMVTYLLLVSDESTKDTFEVMVISSEISPAERQKIVNKFNEPCTKNSRNKVLIAVLGVAAEGFNIPRASLVIFAELPVTFAKMQQGKGRAYRQGQTIKVKVVKLQEEGNLMEMYSYQMMEAKDVLQRLIYNVRT